MKPKMLLLLLCSLFSSQYAQSVYNNSSAREQILSVLHRQIDGWNRGDIESFMQGYIRSDSLRFASRASVTYGWKNMFERYQNNYPTKEKMGVLTFTEINVDCLSDDAAIVFGTWRLKREKDEPWGLFTLIFKNKNGQWRIVHDHTSSGN